MGFIKNLFAFLFTIVGAVGLILCFYESVVLYPFLERVLEKILENVRPSVRYWQIGVMLVLISFFGLFLLYAAPKKRWRRR